jgi:archaemetzincin
LLVAAVVVAHAAVGAGAEGARSVDRGFEFDPELFQKMGKPRPGDWLDRFKETHRSFGAYVASRPVGPTRARKAIVLQPYGPFTTSERARLEGLRQYAAIYFQVPVRIEEPLPLPTRKKYLRKRNWGGRTWTQYKTDYFFETMPGRLPKDAICYLGITLADLYPEESWNYVFGQASLRQRVGIYSLARHRAKFWGEKETKETKKQELLRGVKTLVHEAGHMFSLHHCIRYACVQNGSNSLAESDRRPVFLCPDCLRKLQWNLKFDVIGRYEKMEQFWRASGLTRQADWCKRRVEKLKASR